MGQGQAHRIPGTKKYIATYVTACSSVTGKTFISIGEQNENAAALESYHRDFVLLCYCIKLMLTVGCKYSINVLAYMLRNTAAAMTKAV